MTALASGPIIGADLLRLVVTTAQGMCACTSECGRAHRKLPARPTAADIEGGGRCLAPDTPGSPLHAVPRKPCGPATEMKLRADDLMAFCDDCHRRLITRRSRAARHAAAAAIAADQGGLF